MHFILDTYLILLSVKKGSIKYNFCVVGMNKPGIEPWSRGTFANTLFIGPMGEFIRACVKISHLFTHNEMIEFLCF